MEFPCGTKLEEVNHLDWAAGRMEGLTTQRSVKTLGQLAGVFLDSEEWVSMPQEATVYTVEWQQSVPQDTPGGLYWGSTRIEPGLVGDEYFMTRGHFHARRDRAEYYCTVQGEGMLLLMDEARQTRVERMVPGTLHYIPGHTAHRAVNVGANPLLFWACWPSDAGHDYETIAKQHFSVRIVRRHGRPEVIQENLPRVAIQG
jgi:glucose-6-phosphate isomerase